MPDFLLELLSEEIPARMQFKAQQDLARLFSEQLSSAGLAAEAIETCATPRRLILIARNLPAETDAVREETKGPRTSAPPQALEGFLRKTGLTKDRLEERDGVWFATVEKPGRATASVLAEAIPALVRAFPWPKSMRWGAASASTESPRWVRPLQGIIALLGEEIVDFEIAGIRSGAATVGHRFHHPGQITLGGAQDYVEKLKACHVVSDPAERRRIIAEGANAAAAAAGLALVEDEGLLAENAGLTEWPVPLLGRFDPAFLEVPREVIQLTMRTNQKYFAVTDEKGELAPAFVCTANIEALDGGASIVAGNERVLSARLSDATFFWEQDLKVPLEEQSKKLGDIVFHEKLGTVADKVDRVAKLARWLVEEGIIPLPEREGLGVGPAEGGRNTDAEGLAPLAPTPSPSLPGRGDLASLAERAARLCKADLVTQMVGEFPELQGLIGGHLARAQSEHPAVADAIRDHYKPVGQGDEVPTAPVTVAVSLADKLDSLFTFYGIEEEPTGSKDPFALRRSALGVIQLLVTNGFRLSITRAFEVHRNLALQGYTAHDDLQAMVGRGPTTLSFGDELTGITGLWRVRKIPRKGLNSIQWEQPFLKLVDWVFILPKRTKGSAFQEDVDRAPFRFRADSKPIASLDSFFADRLKVQQREAGVRHDLIDAVFALGGEDDLVRLLARVKALQAFVETPEGADLLAGYKRAANILKKEGYPVIPAKAGTSGQEVSAGLPEAPASVGVTEQSQNKPLPYTPDKEEDALIAALDSAEPRARAAVDAEDFEGAMAALASLR
ncbi:MAG TPA: glycine--tRNA ligase subunit beta, partial [Allosphingosinicella sp.]